MHFVRCIAIISLIIVTANHTVAVALIECKVLIFGTTK